ncbi:hypothetical protein PR048_022115 [Dryococelus australis]|uniref:Integrase catalytic domain-containing protein n=1 Tax=Dryococelus australis TaxID=614101 RepID=A0ABQ9H075_9NEOP|nr:hypothetical protein PR048_022115 [Dryococelus australis]
MSKGQSTNRLWHDRLGHLNRMGMAVMKKGMADGISFSGEKDEQCIKCLEGKQSRKPFKGAGGKRVSQCLQSVHSDDLCGPMPQESRSGGRSKVQVFEKFREFTAQVEKQTGKQIKILRTDNGSEYVNRDLKNFLRNQGIKHELTIPYSPKQNGLEEHTNCTLVEKARCTMKKDGSDEKMWAEALNTAAYLANKLPHKATGVKTPEEWWYGRKKQKHKKWDSKSYPYIFVGYCEDSKGYRLFDTINPGKIVHSRDVVFLEDKFLVNEQQSTDMTTVDARLPSVDIES